MKDLQIFYRLYEHCIQMFSQKGKMLWLKIHRHILVFMKMTIPCTIPRSVYLFPNKNKTKSSSRHLSYTCMRMLEIMMKWLGILIQHMCTVGQAYYICLNIRLQLQIATEYISV